MYNDPPDYNLPITHQIIIHLRPGFDLEQELYEVRYDDGDGEELYEDDLSRLLTNGDIE